MRTYNLTFISKNKKSLNNAFFFFKQFNQNIIQKSFVKKVNKKFVTLLKSPHINKKAQEQFEFKTFSRQITIFSPKSIKSLFFLKKINKNIFSDVKIQIKLLINKKKEKDLKINIFDINNFKLNIYNNTINKTSNNLVLQKNLKNTIFTDMNNKKIKSFLQLLDIYGELTI